MVVNFFNVFADLKSPWFHLCHLCSKNVCPGEDMITHIAFDLTQPTLHCFIGRIPHISFLWVFTCVVNYLFCVKQIHRGCTEEEEKIRLMKGKVFMRKNNEYNCWF